ncbi:STAS-like domain-containing protein [Mesorhizobium sp. CA13]|uniref:STAS-like domain-containing protein n=1 Tax=Mesorhizobium sp. CA13 TaxID=2876643 RepID=UPI001CCFE75C|nr:STAS-like domain-containing protein [Mesorhizobium sp. CA13]MBZ9854302.1 STAS-like domain-containing protein [Mesorhizobium sp. CA13]
MNRVINIASDFTRYPGPRYSADGPFSGEEFRNSKLVPALEDAKASGGMVTVILDGVAGYGSSFLEESFGGLLRVGFTPADVKKHLRVVALTSRFQHHSRNVDRYIAEASLTAAA